MELSLLSYFTDPVLRGPTIGSMLMCLGASLVGVLVFLKKQSLIGESLSHAAYPGVIIGVLLAGNLQINDSQDFLLSFLIMSGAGFTALLGLLSIQFLENKLKIKSDAALCFVLSAFFGVGLTLASEVQFSFANLYRQSQSYLYGQAATMTDVHVLIYVLLALLIALVISFYFKEIKVLSFDRDYAISLGINVKWIEAVVFLLIVLAVVIGIRSVGVVLMSAMLISPAVAARQFTNSLKKMFLIAAFFGLISGFLGNYLALETSLYMSKHYQTKFAFPTGPMIVLTASILCFLSLLFAPKRGILIRVIKMARFKKRCLLENLLKAIWRIDAENAVSIKSIAKQQSASYLFIYYLLWRLKAQGWLTFSQNNSVTLTKDGKIRAAKIIRLHRLWEVYLVDYLGASQEKVHISAEEMEHVITPELEKQLSQLLKNPKKDPHQQPIPPEVIL